MNSLQDKKKKAEDEASEVLFEMPADHVAVITLNRPRVRNAVNGALAEQLDAAAERVEKDDDIWVAILTTSNNKAFCSGADLKELSEGRADKMMTPKGGFAGFADYPKTKPWIAAVRGVAMGGGCELPLACDLIVASEDSVFGLPEVTRGLMASAGGVHRLPRAIPRNIALELVVTGEPISAKRAMELGLVNRLATDESVMDTALELAKTIARNAPLAVRESLRIARSHSDLTDDELRKLSVETSKRLSKTEDFQEGPRAFLEKRPPCWKGR